MIHSCLMCKMSAAPSADSYHESGPESRPRHVLLLFALIPHSTACIAVLIAQSRALLHYTHDLLVNSICFPHGGAWVVMLNASERPNSNVVASSEF